MNSIVLNKMQDVLVNHDFIQLGVIFLYVKLAFATHEFKSAF